MQCPVIVGGWSQYKSCLIELACLTLDPSQWTLYARKMSTVLHIPYSAHCAACAGNEFVGLQRATCEVVCMNMEPLKGICRLHGVEGDPDHCYCLSKLTLSGVLFLSSICSANNGLRFRLQCVPSFRLTVNLRLVKLPNWFSILASYIQPSFRESLI